MLALFWPTLIWTAFGCVAFSLALDTAGSEILLYSNSGRYGTS